jgi:hypothetical protein
MIDRTAKSDAEVAAEILEKLAERY